MIISGKKLNIPAKALGASCVAVFCQELKLRALTPTQGRGRAAQLGPGHTDAPAKGAGDSPTVTS